MRIKIKLVFCSLCCCTNFLFGATTNYLDTVMKLSPEEATKYIRSLPEEAVWQMASEGYEKGLNEYGIAVGILGQAGPSFDWEKHPPTREKLVGLISNPSLHPGLRGALAAGGFDRVAKDWKLDEFLSYLDSVLVLLQDPKIQYRWKWEIPDDAARGILKRMQPLLHNGSDASSLQGLDALHDRDAQIMGCLTDLLAKLPDTPENSLGDVCGGLMEFARLYHERTFPSTEASRHAVGMAKAGREALIQVLRGHKYSLSTAKVVLRRGDTIRLSDDLTGKDIATLKLDSRFSDEESAKLLLLWEQKMGNAKGIKP